jgi:tetratricopeptide (TPR) repeat protein
MDILKKDSCSTFFLSCLFIFGMVLLIAQNVFGSNSSTAKEALMAAYRTGVIYFKANKQDDAKAVFRQTAGDANCPDLIRICCFNMTGQISRLQGNDKEALEAFEQAAKLLESKEHNASPEFVRLLCLVLFARGEIYEVQESYSQSISEYNRLIQVLRQNSNSETAGRYIPPAGDRISQAYLRMGDVNSYIKNAEELSADYPQYYRIPVIKLEVECVKFLKSHCVNFDPFKGSFSAPAQLIAYFKDSKDSNSAQEIMTTFDNICKEYSSGYDRILLQYHYAWLLDTLGEKNKAAKIFAMISAAKIPDNEDKPCEKVILETVAEYARIQLAILLGERADYTEALRILSTMQTHPDKSHISELAKSIGKNLETLKREVSENGKK